MYRRPIKYKNTPQMCANCEIKCECGLVCVYCLLVVKMAVSKKNQIKSVKMVLLPPVPAAAAIITANISITNAMELRSLILNECSVLRIISMYFHQKVLLCTFFHLKHLEWPPLQHKYSTLWSYIIKIRNELVSSTGSIHGTYAL